MLPDGCSHLQDRHHTLEICQGRHQKLLFILRWARFCACRRNVPAKAFSVLSILFPNPGLQQEHEASSTEYRPAPRSQSNSRAVRDNMMCKLLLHKTRKAFDKAETGTALRNFKFFHVSASSAHMPIVGKDRHTYLSLQVDK